MDIISIKFKSLPQINDYHQYARQKGRRASLDEILSDPSLKIQSKQIFDKVPRESAGSTLIFLVGGQNS